MSHNVILERYVCAICLMTIHHLDLLFNSSHMIVSLLLVTCPKHWFHEPHMTNSNACEIFSHDIYSAHKNVWSTLAIRDCGAFIELVYNIDTCDTIKACMNEYNHLDNFRIFNSQKLLTNLISNPKKRKKE